MMYPMTTENKTMRPIPRTGTFVCVLALLLAACSREETPAAVPATEQAVVA